MIESLNFMTTDPAPPWIAGETITPTGKHEWYLLDYKTGELKLMAAHGKRTPKKVKKSVKKSKKK